MTRIVFPKWGERQPETGPNAPWLRLYRHQGSRFMSLPLRARNLFHGLLAYTDEHGAVHLPDGKDPVAGLCFVMGGDRGDRRMVRDMLPKLIDAGFLAVDGATTEQRSDNEATPNVQRSDPDPATNVPRSDHERATKVNLTTGNDSTQLGREEKREEKREREAERARDFESLKRDARREFGRRFEQRTGAAYMAHGRHDSALGKLAAAALRQVEIDGCGEPLAVLVRVLDAFFADDDPFLAQASWAPSVAVQRWAQYAKPRSDGYVPIPDEDPEAYRARLRALR